MSVSSNKSHKDDTLETYSENFNPKSQSPLENLEFFE